MTFWLIDDGPLGLLARTFDATWSWPAATLHVVGAVAAAAPLDRSGRRQQLLAMGPATERAVVVHELLADSPAGEFFFGHLRPTAAAATKDLGEDQAIALCATTEPEAVFVTADRGAAFVALAELGPGRVATPFDVWEDLARRGLITDAQRRVLMTLSFKGDGGLPGWPRRFPR